MKQKKPIYKRVWFIAIVIIIVLGVIVSLGGEDSSTKQNVSKETAATSETTTEENQEEAITYKKYTAKKLMNDLEKNALKAEEDYNDQYVRITGILGTIDSSGSYITIQGDEYDIIGIQCYVKDDKQLDQIKKLSAGDKIVVKGQITDVGEIMGYSLDIDSIKASK